MTREEAIAQLKMDRDLANFNPMTGEEEPMNEDCRKSVEALDMAIKALEQEPCEDTISRQAAIDALHMHLMYRMGTDSNKKRLDEWINNLPSAQPEQQIPQMRGWVCPVCGRGLSPYTSVCPCNNGKGWEITC